MSKKSLKPGKEMRKDLVNPNFCVTHTHTHTHTFSLKGIIDHSCAARTRACPCRTVFSVPINN